MARAWVELMKRLGYSRFAAQGGDWGGFVTNVMAEQAPPELIGIHVNFSGAAPPDVARALQFGEPAPAGLSAEEQRAYDQMAFLYQHVPTQLMMAAHPQTLYGLADSPVALAAWMIDHDVASYGHIAKLFVDGSPYGDLTRDDILDNITLSWLTNTGISSARLDLPAPCPALWLDPGGEAGRLVVGFPGRPDATRRADDGSGRVGTASG
jgi:pimeloyl-ACP methyl ester carboxylesterase